VLLFPLTPANRRRLGEAFAAVPRVDLSIDCVLEGAMGRVWVDDPQAPSVFRLQTGPFVYLAGGAAGEAGRALMAGLEPGLLLMPSAPGWLEALQAHFGPQLEAMERYRFTAASLAPERLRALAGASRYAARVRALDRDAAEAVWGGGHVIDLSEYASPGDFVERGLGFYAGEPGAALGAAYAALVCRRGIEVSVYVERAHRQRGMATALASRLLLASLERGLEPHWDAANPESYRLALKLGYTPAGIYQAHWVRGSDATEP
jgi:hypothetical protein